MNKLLKRLLMLGMLTGCMATAALAGNVEVDWLDGNTDCDVNPAAEGYYQDSHQYFYFKSANEKNNFDKITYDFYFDADGNMTWGKWANGEVTYRNDYDKDGNLIRAVYDSDEKSIETFTYDDSGLLTMSHNAELVKDSDMSSTYYYTYGDNQITVKASYNDSDGSSTKTFVYTLDDHGNVVKCVTDNGAVDTYTYDARGNLTERQCASGGKHVYEYNDRDLCVKDTFVSDGGYENATTYQYDEHGNVIEEVHYGSWGYNFTYAPIPQEGSVSDFEDVKAADYYNAPVIWAGANGITKGMTATQFRPGNPCTRAQLVTFLWRAAGSPDPKNSNNPFTDVDLGAYYGKAVLWAVENGVTKGTSADKFSPNAQCTRGQIVTFIYRAAGEPKVQNTNNPFTDVKGGAFYNAILWAVENGITNGYANGEFRPNNTCTRAQGVTFLYRGIGLY